jgi:hypothetical protein
MKKCSQSSLESSTATSQPAARTAPGVASISATNPDLYDPQFWARVEPAESHGPQKIAQWRQSVVVHKALEAFRQSLPSDFSDKIEQLTESTSAVQGVAIQRAVQQQESATAAVAAAKGPLPSACFQRTALGCTMDILEKRQGALAATLKTGSAIMGPLRRTDTVATKAVAALYQLAAEKGWPAGWTAVQLRQIRTPEGHNFCVLYISKPMYNACCMF